VPENQGPATVARRDGFAAAGWLLALTIVALVVRIGSAAATGFDGLYGQDPFAYFDYARTLHGALLTLTPPPPFFYPIGYPLLVAVAMLLVGVQPLAGQAVSVFAGALAAPASYALVREIKPGSTVGPVVAGLLAAFAPQLVISSLSVNSDAAAFLFALLSALAIARYLARLETRWLALAALALGMAVLTRWVYALAALPWAAATLVAWRGASLPLRERLAAASLAVAIGGAIVGSQFAGELRSSGFSHVGDVAIARWDPANAVRTEITNPDGVFHYPVPVAAYYALPIVHPAFVFPLLAPFAWLGLVSLRRAFIPHVVLLLGWLLVMVAFFAGFAWENPRFPLSYFAPLVALVGIGAEAALERLPRRRAVMAWCALGLAGSLAWTARDVPRFADRKQADLDAAIWCQRRVPPEARVLAFDLTETLRHYTPLEVVEIFDETPATLAGLVGGGRPTYLVADAANLALQWVGRSPQINLEWLRGQTALAEVGRVGRYTLWRVGARRPAQTARQGSP
jgi:4-amino-4-deoxy-L-arabinose transferase-like glycosyltransferase